MSAITVIEGLIKLGTIIADVKAKKADSGEFDFAAFLNDDAPKNMQATVKSILSGLKPGDIASAIAGVESKQKDLLAGEAVVDLSNEKLIQYATLNNTKLLLNTAQVKQAADADFYVWLADDGLPDLIKIAGVVLPLLV